MAAKNRKKQILVAVSGGFDPVHVGHVRMFKEAKKLGDKLVIILNNDNWLKAKKGCVFMPQEERKELLEALSPVDEVILTNHEPQPKDMSVCRELAELKPQIFANGGDRTLRNIPEVATCEAIGCEMIFSIGAGGKVQSSSWLLGRYLKENKLQGSAKASASKKIIAFDLDGTLTKSKAGLDPEMAAFFCKLLEKKKAAVIGGGNYNQFKDQFLNYLKCSDSQFENLLLLPTSGSEFHKYQAGVWHKIYKHQLTFEEKNKILEAFNKAFKDINYKQPNKIYGETIEDRGSQITFSALGQKAPLLEKQEWNQKHDIRMSLMRILKRYLGEFEIRLGGLTSIDITKKGIDKAYGIMEILKLLNLKKKDILFIGDALYKGGNDYIVKKTGIATLQVKDHEETKTFLRLLLELC